MRKYVTNERYTVTRKNEVLITAIIQDAILHNTSKLLVKLANSTELHYAIYIPAVNCLELRCGNDVVARGVFEVYLFLHNAEVTGYEIM